MTVNIAFQPATLINDLAAQMCDPADDLAMLEVLGKLAAGVESNIGLFARSAAKTATWQEVGDALGISRQAAHKRFSR